MDMNHIEDELLPEWAFVEVMGHSKIAGKLSAVKLGLAVMLQVQVMKADGKAVAYSKMYSPASLFSITPVSREYCLEWSKQAEAHDVRPVPWYPMSLAQLPERSEPDEDEEPDDFFEWCEQRGFCDVATSGPSCPSERLREALEAYEIRNEDEDDDEES